MANLTTQSDVASDTDNSLSGGRTEKGFADSIDVIPSFFL